METSGVLGANSGIVRDRGTAPGLARRGRIDAVFTPLDEPGGPGQGPIGPTEGFHFAEFGSKYFITWLMPVN